MPLRVRWHANSGGLLDYTRITAYLRTGSCYGADAD